MFCFVFFTNIYKYYLYRNMSIFSLCFNSLYMATESSVAY